MLPLPSGNLRRIRALRPRVEQNPAIFAERLLYDRLWFL